MEKKLYDANDITLDGRMDEPVWNEVPEQTGFREIEIIDNKTANPKAGELAEAQTSFKVLPCEDCVYFGIKCIEPDVDFLKSQKTGDIHWTNTVELFLAPTNEGSSFYHFLCSFNGEKMANFFIEHGNVIPQKYMPVWEYAVYAGDGYWSVEVKLPLKIFFFTPNSRWSDTWLINLMRAHVKRRTAQDAKEPMIVSSWGVLNKSVREPDRYRHLGGFPMRRLCDEVCMSNAEVEINKYNGKDYEGTMKVTVRNGVAAEFVFTSDHSAPVNVALDAGTNFITVPCYFEELGRQEITLRLMRVSDGEVFQCSYKIAAEYEPIKISFTLPEYRTNFYPGQDYSKIVGKVVSGKPVTLKLEGPGFETTVISPEEDGSFVFETPNFQVGEATLTASIDGWEIKKTMRRLAPTGHTMTWISGGNLVINGKPTLRHNMYAPYYRVSEVFKRQCYVENQLHETAAMTEVSVQAPVLIPASEQFGGECFTDGQPSEEMRKKIDEVIEKNRDKDFGFYYLSDEPVTRGVSLIYIKNCYNYIIEKDPYHVVAIAGHLADRHLETCDLFDVECYLGIKNTPEGRIYETPITSGFETASQMISKQFRPDKCYGAMPATYAYRPYAEGRDYQTFDEVLSQTWAGILRGSKSIWVYASHDLNDRPGMLEGVRYVFTTFEALEDLVLFGKRTVLLRTDEVEAAVFDAGDEKMFALMNLTQKPQHVTLDGIDGEWHRFRRGGIISGNTFDLKPLEIVVGTSKVRDANLPTYDEVAALVEKLEYQRTHGGSLLFNRYTDLEVTASRPIVGYKLFDGTLDNWAWACNGGNDKFVELNLTKVKPTFSKVVVSGWHTNDVEVKCRNNDELSIPEIAEIQTEEFSTTIILKEPVCPDALRLEFPQFYIELYEIEVF